MLTISLAVISLYITGTVKRNFIWRDDLILWMDAVKKSPANSTAHYNLGTIYQNKGWLAKAKIEYKESLKLKPEGADAHYNLGVIYTKESLLDEAIFEFEETLKINPEHQESRQQLEKLRLLKQLKG